MAVKQVGRVRRVQISRLADRRPTEATKNAVISNDKAERGRKTDGRQADGELATRSARARVAWQQRSASAPPRRSAETLERLGFSRKRDDGALHELASERGKSAREVLRWARQKSAKHSLTCWRRGAV